MRVMRMLAANALMLLPILEGQLSLWSHLAHEWGAKAGLAIAILEVAKVYWDYRKKRVGRMPRCIMIASMGAGCFILGSVAAVHPLRDGGYCLFTLGHLAKAAVELVGRHTNSVKLQ